MKHPNLGMGFVVALTALAGASAQTQGKNTEQRLKDVESRLADLENVTSEIEERAGSRALIQAFSAENLDLGGHLTSIFTGIQGEDASDIGHLATFLELFIKAKIDEKTSVFATPGFYIFNPVVYANPRRPSLAGENPSSRNVVLARAYVEHKHCNLLGIQVGILGTPHGVTNRDYFLPSRTLMTSNLHTRAFLANLLYAQQLQGIKISGTTPASDSGSVSLGYDIYAGFEDTDPNELESGLRLGVTFEDLGLTIAANAGEGSREAYPSFALLPPSRNVPTLTSPFPTHSNVRTDYSFYGVDIDLRTERFHLNAEAYISEEGNTGNRKAFSIHPAWWVREDIALSYRFDYFRAGNLGQATEHTVGISYDYHPGIRLRLDAAHQELPNSPNSVDYVNASFSISF